MKRKSFPDASAALDLSPLSQSSTLTFLFVVNIHCSPFSHLIHAAPHFDRLLSSPHQQNCSYQHHRLSLTNSQGIFQPFTSLIYVQHLIQTFLSFPTFEFFISIFTNIWLPLLSFEISFSFLLNVYIAEEDSLSPLLFSLVSSLLYARYWVILSIWSQLLTVFWWLPNLYLHP